MIILKVKNNNPWKEIKENENEMKKILEYIDSIVIIMNLRINIAILKKHSYQKASSKIKCKVSLSCVMSESPIFISR